MIHMHHNQTFARSRFSSKTFEKINFCNADKYHRKSDIYILFIQI